MTPEPGDIVLIPFPYSDLSSAKKRPVLVLTPLDRHGDFIAAGITSAEQQGDAVILNTESLLSGRLPKKSWVRTDKVFTLSREIVEKRFGAVRAETFQAVMLSVCRTLGCIEKTGNIP